MKPRYQPARAASTISLPTAERRLAASLPAQPLLSLPCPGPVAAGSGHGTAPSRDATIGVLVKLEKRKRKVALATLLTEMRGEMAGDAASCAGDAPSCAKEIAPVATAASSHGARWCTDTVAASPHSMHATSCSHVVPDLGKLATKMSPGRG